MKKDEKIILQYPDVVFFNESNGLPVTNQTDYILEIHSDDKKVIKKDNKKCSDPIIYEINVEDKIDEKEK